MTDTSKILIFHKISVFTLKNIYSTKLEEMDEFLGVY